jgi:hypothetical protein
LALKIKIKAIFFGLNPQNYKSQKVKRNARASSGVLLVFFWHDIDVIKKLHLCPF